MMTYPDDCRAYKAKAESMEGHIRRMPATGKPSGADRADAFEPFETRFDSSGSFFMLYFLKDDIRLKGDTGLNESELYKELGSLTRNREKWEESIPSIAALLSHESVKIQAKALWLIGEMGFAYPASVHDYVSLITHFLDSEIPLLRERAVNALGRIGRGSYPLIEPYWAVLFRFANDKDARVRLSFIWASENIATNTPDIYENCMPVFEALLHDEDDKVRMEAPEIFRVLGKRRPEFVKPYIETLRCISETDANRVVRIHCQGAIKAVQKQV
jgi:HEAT repeat protein